MNSFVVAQGLVAFRCYMGFFLIFQMKFDKSKWKELDINVDSLWIMGPRAKGGKHENVYHGNFAPQIPNQMIRRYTEEGGNVLEMFMGSGTTLFECETLGRNYI